MIYCMTWLIDHKMGVPIQQSYIDEGNDDKKDVNGSILW